MTDDDSRDLRRAVLDVVLIRCGINHDVGGRRASGVGCLLRRRGMDNDL